MTLTTRPIDPILDLLPYRGQRVERYRFAWLDGTTNQVKGYVHPLRGTAPQLRHDTTGTIKRQLTLSLHTDETAAVNPIVDRILPYVIIGGTTWPLGRYMFTDPTFMKSSAGNSGTYTLLDEGFIIDQQMSTAFSSSDNVTSAIFALITGLPLKGAKIEATDFAASGAFAAGQTRGEVLRAYETLGDFFPYWMDNDGFMRMVRTKDPATAVPDFDLDAGGLVKRSSVSETNDILTAPNRFIVISNSGDADTSPIVGTYDVPPSAPHSIAKRGFVIPDVQQLQLPDATQATAVARNLGIRGTVFERVSLTTPIDPRHDSYDVVRFDGVNWLELSWTMTLVPGGDMTHTMRKAYI